MVYAETLEAIITDFHNEEGDAHTRNERLALKYNTYAGRINHIICTAQHDGLYDYVVAQINMRAHKGRK